jgi:uncharacterized membrane protein
MRNPSYSVAAVSLSHRLRAGIVYACLITATFAMPVLAHGTKVHKQPNTELPVIVQQMDEITTSKEKLDHTHVPATPAATPQVIQSEPVHDHSAHGPNAYLFESSGGRLMVWFGRLHPAAVHFPIGLLMAAALAEMLSLRFSPRFFRNAVRFCLWTGAISAFGAALLGWFYGGFRLLDTELIMSVHRWNGTGLAVLGLLALWNAERRDRGVNESIGLRGCLLLIVIMIGVNGYTGGLMVYGAQQHQWPVELPEHPQ